MYSDFVEEVVQCICGQFWDLRGKPKIAERPITYGYANDNRSFKAIKVDHPAETGAAPAALKSILPQRQYINNPKTPNKPAHRGIAL